MADTKTLTKHAITRMDGDKEQIVILWLLPEAERPEVPAGARVLRQANVLSCYECAAAQGIYDQDDPYCWATHPNCNCKWQALPEGVAMSKLNTAQRKALPLADFGDPANRLYPIVDQDDVDSAAHLIGKARNPEAVKARIIAIAKRKNLSIPDAWKVAAHSAGVVSFGAEGEPLAGDGRRSGDTVTRTGLLFKAGTHTDMHGIEFTITPDELRAVADGPGTGYVELEHFRTFGQQSMLDGECGRVSGLWASEDGERLYGDVELPAWLDDIASKHGHKVSSIFDIPTKAFRGVGMVLEPGLPDTALFGAYAAFAAKHNTPQGQYAMQRIHDVAADQGAVCSSSNAAMASRHEATAIQQIHDTAVEHGATCASTSQTGTSVRLFGAPAGTKPSVYAAPHKGGKPMGRFLSNFRFWHTAGPEVRDEARAEGLQLPDEAAFSQFSAEARALAKSELGTELETMRKERDEAIKATQAAFALRFQAEGTAYIDSLITANKLLPVEREPAIAAYAQSAQDDAAHGTVAFADGKQSSRIAGFKALYDARPAHTLTVEGGTQTVAPDGKGNFRIVPAAFAGQQQADVATTPTADGAAVKPERAAHLLKLAGVDAKKEA